MEERYEVEGFVEDPVSQAGVEVRDASLCVSLFGECMNFEDGEGMVEVGDLELAEGDG